METNATHTQMPDYGQNNVTSQGSSPNAKTLAQFEQFKAMVCGDLINENNALRKENEELKTERKEHVETITSQAVDIKELKKRLIHTQELLKTVDECKATGIARPMYKYEYDLTDFKTEAGINDVDYLFDCLLYLVDFQIKPEVYLINKASDIIPVFLVLTKDNKLENTKFRFCGSLTAFCDYWNSNIVPHITDSKRAEKLACKYTSIKATIGKTPWKGTDPISWRRLASESPKKKKIYQQAFNIKERIVNMLTA